MRLPLNLRTVAGNAQHNYDGECAIMDINVTLDSVCALSEDVVARDIEGELIIVPLASGVGDMEDELYTLNETGRAIWERLDGVRSLRQVVEDLSAEYQADGGEIAADVVGLVTELVRRKLVSVVPNPG